MTTMKRARVRKTISYKYDLMPLEDHEKNIIREALDRCEGNVGDCAKSLGIAKSTMYEKLYGYGIRRRTVR